MSDQIASSQIIEFFWFFFPFLLFINAILLKFYIKTSIHLDQLEDKAIAYSQQNINDPKQHETDLQGSEIQIVEQSQQMNKVDQGQIKQIDEVKQLQQIKQNLAKNSRTAKFFNGLNQIISTYFPLLSVSIICINNFAAWSWAVACVFIFLFFVIAFNIIKIQHNFPDTIKRFLYVSHHIWLCGLFISYIACKLKLVK